MKKAIAVALACSSMALGSVAWAHDDHRGRGDWHGHGYGNYERGHDRGWHGGPPRVDYRPVYRPGPVVVVREGPRRPYWARGDRLPGYGHGGGYYVVNDWDARRLYRPQPGYQWVQVGPDYLLVAIASGIIASAIMNH